MSIIDWLGHGMAVLFARLSISTTTYHDRFLWLCTIYRHGLPSLEDVPELRKTALASVLITVAAAGGWEGSMGLVFFF